MHNRLILACSTAAVLSLSILACVAAADNETPNSLKTVWIKDVPHVRQKPDFCGEACAEMFLAKLGKKMDQDFVFDKSGLDPIHGRGCYTRELATSLQRIGFQTGPIWYTVSAARAEAQLSGMFREMHADLAAGVPSIVCMHYDDQPQTTEHFRLVLGYDAKTDEVLYHEPAVRRGAYRRMKRDELLKLWPLKYDRNRWTVIRMRLKPGRLVDGVSSTEVTDADYAQHIRRLKSRLRDLKETQVALKKRRDAEIAEYLEEERKRLEELRKRKEREAREKREKSKDSEKEKRDDPPADEPIRFKPTPRIVSDFQIVLQKPFVVIGDESLAQVRGHCRGTIDWAVDRLKKDYFSKNPDHVIEVWLFKDKQSYRQNMYDIFRTRPHTPYGFYWPSQKALVMNIDTGGGTLVHEIVHPFVAANFPDCPSWLNEGLGSLYEQCRDNRGHIWGRVNWRLRGLHEALKDEDYEMPTFEELCKTTTDEFYGEDPGTNYAQARYLCYYLQEKGLLVKFYHEFQKSVKDDPSGYETLQRILDEEDMEKFQEKWKEFVLKLRF